MGMYRFVCALFVFILYSFVMIYSAAAYRTLLQCSALTALFSSLLYCAALRHLSFIYFLAFSFSTTFTFSYLPYRSFVIFLTLLLNFSPLFLFILFNFFLFLSTHSLPSSSSFLPYFLFISASS